jgi:hypothetical protein
VEAGQRNQSLLGPGDDGGVRQEYTDLIGGFVDPAGSSGMFRARSGLGGTRKKSITQVCQGFGDFGPRYGKAAELKWAAADSNHLPPR